MIIHPIAHRIQIIAQVRVADILIAFGGGIAGVMAEADWIEKSCSSRSSEEVDIEAHKFWGSKHSHGCCATAQSKYKSGVDFGSHELLALP